MEKAKIGDWVLVLPKAPLLDPKVARLTTIYTGARLDPETFVLTKRVCVTDTEGRKWDIDGGRVGRKLTPLEILALQSE